MRPLLWISWFVIVPSVWAGQVCLHRGTGVVIEYQSNATPGTCTKNALTAGYAAAEIDEREITDTDWSVMEEEKIRKPERDAAKQEAPVEIPLGSFGAGAAGALAILGGQGLVILAKKKKSNP